ncbi:MAG: hypothetical protein ACJ78V_01280 [Myxococcales bacterium]
MGIILKSSDEIAKMRATGRIVRAVLDASKPPACRASAPPS